MTDRSVREQVEEAYRDFCACKSIEEEKSVGVYCRIVLLNNRRLFASSEEVAARLLEVEGELAELRAKAWQLAFMLNRASGELNTIRARNGVPYNSDGSRASIDEEYFSSVIEDSWKAMEDFGTPFVPWDLKKPAAPTTPTE